jgi:signal transduction histidine kinase
MVDQRKHLLNKMFEEEQRRSMRRAEDQRLLDIEQELEATLQVREVLFDELDFDDVIKKSLETALEVVSAEGGSILVAEHEAEELIYSHSLGKYPVQRGTSISWKDGIVGRVFHSGEPEIIDDLGTFKNLPPGIDYLVNNVTRDLVAVPLKWRGGDPVGVLEVLNKRSGQFDKSDLAILMVVSAISANAIERARLYEEAKLAEVARLLGNIGHDIKNLLTPVVYGSEVLEEELEKLFESLEAYGKAGLDSRRRRCRNTIAALYGSSRRIQDRVKEISDCIKGLNTAPRYESCRIHHIVAEVFEALRLSSKRKGVHLKSLGLDVLPELKADERRLFNALYNLVNNAIPEVSEGGTVTVSGETVAADGILISVVDNGRGMPAEVRDSLFTKNALSRKRLGTGLGTKIVKDVVDEHKGRISIESEEGSGTTIRIYLPLDPTLENPIAQPET